MKVVAFLIAIVLFVGSLALFGFAFNLDESWRVAAFIVGILGVSLSLAIPFHLLSRAD